MSTDTELQTRVEDLEMKLTFQDDLIEKLNQSLVAQQQDIRKLTRLVEKLGNQLQDIQEPNVIDQNMEEPPPHY